MNKIETLDVHGSKPDLLLGAMAGLTQQLAAFVAGLAFEKLPQQAVETAKRGAIDTIGVMFAGRDEPVAKLAAELVAPASSGEAHVLFDRGFARSQDASLVNGTAGHALDYDDVAIDGHPSVVLVPDEAAGPDEALERARSLVAQGKEKECMDEVNNARQLAGR